MGSGNPEGTLQLPPQLSTIAADTDATYYFIYWICVVFFVAIIGLMAVFMVKYRKRPGAPPVKQITHNLALELSWSVLPAFLLLVMFVWGFRGYMNVFVAPDDAMEVTVIGKRWLWDFKYDNGAVTTGELHVPVNTPVKLIMRSDDVLHSFFVPDFRVKHDVIPGRYTSLWFEAVQTGTNVVYCTEYCGDGHSRMLAQVIVHTAEDYEKWLAEAGDIGKGLPPVEVGELIYTKKACNTCHSLDGSKKVGPSFKGLWGREEELADGTKVKVDEEYIRESLWEPNAKLVKGYAGVMPTFKGTLSQRHIDGVIAFLKEQK